MLQKLKERLSGARLRQRQEKIQRRRAIQFEMLEKRILPSADLPVVPQALQLNIDPREIAVVSVAYDTQVMQAAQAIQMKTAAVAPTVAPSVDQHRNPQDVVNSQTVKPDTQTPMQLADNAIAKKATSIIFVDERVTDYSTLIGDILKTDAAAGKIGNTGIYNITATTEERNNGDEPAFVLTPASAVLPTSSSSADNTSVAK
jgi:hypothetical protein